MTKTEITLRKLKSIQLSASDGDEHRNPSQALILMAEMMSLGYAMSHNLFRLTCTMTDAEIGKVYADVIPVLRKMKGADVDYTPMYPNFPAQVFEATDIELYFNAFIHYLSDGKWMPHYDKAAREAAIDFIEPIEIDLCDDKQFMNIFTTLLESGNSITGEDTETLEWFMAQYTNEELNFPAEIPFKENLCVVAANFLANDRDIDPLISNTTDVLRVLAHLSGGDITLRERTRFKSLPNRHRKVIFKTLERVVSKEDLQRHRKAWVLVGKQLHVGSHSVRLYQMFSYIRDNKKNRELETYYSRVEKAIAEGIVPAILVLSERPSEFARRIVELHRKYLGEHSNINNNFLSVVHDVPMRVLFQLIGELKCRNFPQAHLKVTADGRVIPNPNANLSQREIQMSNALIESLAVEIGDRRKDLPPMGKVWIDPAMSQCPLPTGMRDASKALRQVAPGTSLPMTMDKNTLRFFLYWKHRCDIDLSAVIMSEDFVPLTHVSYQQLNLNRMGKEVAAHSGDRTNGTEGVAEFIDINIKELLALPFERKPRFIVMNVLMYSGPNFSELSECHAGWMQRDEPNKNDIFDPRTVINKLDIDSDTKSVIPVIFDIHDMKAIYVDLKGKLGENDSSTMPNNVTNNVGTIVDRVWGMIGQRNKPTLFDLFYTHTLTRGELTMNREEADFRVGFDADCNITPFDIDEINANWLE